LALPMWALFELGIVAGRMVKKRERDDDDENSIAS
jgi:Sec-independent protein secretion pathway component TatC